jgi:hypothetical protein
MTNPGQSAQDSARRWRAMARRAAWHVNIGWWLHYLLVPAMGLAVLFAALILIARIQGWPVAPWIAAAALAALLAAAAAWLLARRKFFALDDGLVRLDAHARLHNRLSCAAQGVGDWPAFRADADDGLGWRWRRIVPPLAAALLCLAAAPLVPVRKAATGSGDIQEPSAWSQVEEWVTTLEQEKAAEPEDLKDIREQLEALRRQPRESWYSHSSLEAGDQLRDQAQQAIQELDRSATMAASTLAQALRAQADAATSPDGASPTAAADPSLDRGTMAALQQQWSNALAGLNASGLKPDPALMKALQGIDPSKLKSIDASKLKEIQAKLGQCKGACAACSGKAGDKFCLGGTNAALAALASGNIPGAGGIDRGRGDAPLTFHENEAQAGSTKFEGVSSSDLSGAMPGSVISIQDGRHEVDPNAWHGPEAGGAAAAGGAGEAAWRGDVMPEEQAAVQRFFGQ